MVFAIKRAARRLFTARKKQKPNSVVKTAVVAERIEPEPHDDAQFQDSEAVEGTVAPVREEALALGDIPAIPEPPALVPLEQARIREKLVRIPLPRAFLPLETKEDVLAKLRYVKDTYALVTSTWQNAKYVVATANIRFNELTSQLVYQVEEPPITEEITTTVEKTLRLLQERLEVDPSKLKAKGAVNDYVDQKINEIWEYLGIKLSAEDELKAKYYIFRDTIGFGKIEPLMRDQNIEDISCDGIGVPVYIFHRNSLYGEMPTNITFDSKEELDSFVMKLAQKSGRTISVATPLLDATLPDGSRLQTTFGTDIARRGSNFSIRKFFRLPFTVIDMINYSTADPLTLAYLWLVIDEQLSVLIAGTTAVGKTTFLNSVSQFIRPNLKIVSIEDTAELQLTNVNWVPQIARSGYGPKKYGEVTLFDLLRAALRQRPDYLIVGEVRGREADVMFHAMATGHPALSTIHADDLDSVIDRLTTRPISLPMSLLENLDAIIFLEKGRKDGRLVRRVGKIVEIEGYDRGTGELKSNFAFEWVPAKDQFEAYESLNLAKIAHKLGWSSEKITEEIVRRANVLRWMRNNGIAKFRDVAAIINLYYTNPKQLDQMMHAHKNG